MKEDVVSVPVDTIRRFSEAAFVRLGIPQDDAVICTDVLIRSDLRGIASHGVGRLRMYIDRIRAGMIEPVTEFEVVREGATTAVVDGHHGMGHVIGVRSMRLAIRKAKEYGIGAVAVRNSSHFGIAGYYSLLAVEEGLIGVTMTNARPSVFPTFGGEPIFGTNPIAFGAPTDEGCPFLFDASTSVVPRGKLEVLSRAGTPLPPGWVIDRGGGIATDTDAVLEGLNAGEFGLLPLGGAGETLSGHKGYGFATIVEILSASLQAGCSLQELASFAPDGSPRKQRLGHFFLVIDIGVFTDPTSFRKTTGEILRRLRASRKLPGADRIYTAGEKECERERETASHGIPINPKLQATLSAIRDELGITDPQLPF